MVLLDLIMPKIDGLGVLEKLQQKEGKKPDVIVVSELHRRGLRIRHLV